MLGDLKIYELKPLKGPDRLLRIHTIIENTFEIKHSIDLLAEIVSALIFKHHKILIEFPIEELMSVLPINARLHNKHYGESNNGVLGLEMLFMTRSESVFNIRYYTDDAEFQRKLMGIDTHILLNKIDMNKYKYTYTYGELRDGVEIEALSLKIKYNK